MKKALETHKIIKSKRQPKSLKKLLTSAKLPTENTTPIVKKCGRPNCGTCINLLEGTSYIFKVETKSMCTEIIHIHILREVGSSTKNIEKNKYR